MTILDWQNCYEGGWQDMIVPEAFSHPAKFSRALVVCIIRHGLDEGYFQPGSLLGDPFGGVALGGLIAAYHGLRWVGVELEPRFVAMGNQNIDLHRSRWEVSGDPAPVLLQGDSRRFSEIVGQVAGVVSSPPFSQPGSQPASVLQPGGRQGVRSAYRAAGEDAATTYGQTPGQIGSLPAGSLDGILSSPPFVDSLNNGADHERMREKYPGWGLNADGSNRMAKSVGTDYGSTPGQIGALKSGTLSGILTSPPYAEGLGHLPSPNSERLGREKNIATASYGASEGQIGIAGPDTYWRAMEIVYRQVRLACKPGAVCAFVLKDFVKGGKRVPLCDQTCALLESLGFTVFQRCRCWLVKEQSHPSLFGGQEVKTTSRKSFFRRLCEKRGSPPIDFEEVLWGRAKP